MGIGFVSFNQEALSKANKVMRLLQGQGAIDELGLGRIRDAFSNMMFPGMSVLQTHAKYFLLMPALYAYLEKTRIANIREARSIVRDCEIKLTHRLMDGSADDTVGIIGADMLRCGKGYVKYDLAYIYMAGLETYGLIPHGINIYATLAELSARYQNTPKKHRGSEDGSDDSDDLAGDRQLFITCGENYDFSHREPLDIALSHREAEFLKQKIVTNTRGSLLSYLLDSGLYESITEYLFENLRNALHDIPKELYLTYWLALRYSRFACLLRVRYAMLYNLAVGADRAAEDEQARFDMMLKEYGQEFKPESIDEIIRLVSSKIA